MASSTFVSNPKNRRHLWLIWRKATTYHKLPSEIFGEEDALAAWMLDNAITHFGTLVENMLLERNEVGSGDNRQSVNRYQLSDLLDPTFAYPRPMPKDDLDGMVGVEGLVFDASAPLPALHRRSDQAEPDRSE